MRRRENADVPGDNGLGRTAPPPPDYRDVKAPQTRAEYEAMMDRNVARCLELATSAKELADGLEMGMSWWEKRWKPADGEGEGAGFAALVKANGVTR